jgi:hypothetical protein
MVSEVKDLPALDPGGEIDGVAEFACGARTGVLITRVPVTASTVLPPTGSAPSAFL